MIGYTFRYRVYGFKTWETTLRSIPEVIIVEMDSVRGYPVVKLVKSSSTDMSESVEGECILIHLRHCWRLGCLRCKRTCLTLLTASSLCLSHHCYLFCEFSLPRPLTLWQRTTTRAACFSHHGHANFPATKQTLTLSDPVNCPWHHRLPWKRVQELYSEWSIFSLKTPKKFCLFQTSDVWNGATCT